MSSFRRINEMFDLGVRNHTHNCHNRAALSLFGTNLPFSDFKFNLKDLTLFLYINMRSYQSSELTLTVIKAILL